MIDKDGITSGHHESWMQDARDSCDAVESATALLLVASMIAATCWFVGFVVQWVAA